MPLVLYVLAVAVFAQATSEFMLAGLVPDIAADLAVSVPAAGALTSAFAAGMVLGAPSMALLSRRLPPRAALAGCLVVFVAVHVLGALTPSFPVLLGTRVVAALANAGFLAVALGVAVRLAPEGRVGRATAVLLAGTTLACLAGVPAGALLGEVLGWRSVFWAVALVGAPALVGILVVVPTTAAGAAGSVAGELRALRRPGLVTTLVTGALVNAATFGGYTYVALVVAPGQVAVGLAAFGIGSFLGVRAAGRWGDRYHRGIVAGGGSGLVVGWSALALLVGTTATPVLLGAVGALSFAVGSTLIGRALVLAPDAPTLGGSYATVALNVGAAAGPLLAGAVVADAAAGPWGPGWSGAALVVAAVVVAVAGPAR